MEIISRVNGVSRDYRYDDKREDAMTREEAKKALAEARYNNPQIRKFVFSQASWDAKRQYVWDAQT